MAVPWVAGLEEGGPVLGLLLLVLFLSISVCQSADIHTGLGYKHDLGGMGPPFDYYHAVL